MEHTLEISIEIIYRTEDKKDKKYLVHMNFSAFCMLAIST